MLTKKGSIRVSEALYCRGCERGIDGAGLLSF